MFSRSGGVSVSYCSSSTTVYLNSGTRVWQPHWISSQSVQWVARLVTSHRLLYRQVKPPTDPLPGDEPCPNYHCNGFLREVCSICDVKRCASCCEMILGTGWPCNHYPYASTTPTRSYSPVNVTPTYSPLHRLLLPRATSPHANHPATLERWSGYVGCAWVLIFIKWRLLLEQRHVVGDSPDYEIKIISSKFK